MNILERIVEHKGKEVEARRCDVPAAILEKSPHFGRDTVSLSGALRKQGSTGIIAEFKRKSPSKGIINGGASVERVTRGYFDAGASALSVLTDEAFFGGYSDDLKLARQNNMCPILRKDFTIDEYQILEAKSIGADAILLIAAILTPRQSKEFATLAHSVGLEVLLEVHDEMELKDHLQTGADLIGVNNRNLKDFSVSIETSKKLATMIPDEVVKVSESGISNPATIVELKKSGYTGFLIGENFMKEAEPERAAERFIGELRALVGITA